MRTLEFPIAANTKLYVRGGYASLIVLVLSLLLMVSAIWLGGWCFVAGLAMFSMVCLINSFVIVEAGNTAYKETLGYVSNKVLTNGFHFVLPFITKIVCKETKQTEFSSTDADINMPKGITVKVAYVVTYRLVVGNVYRFAKEWIAPEQAFTSSMKTASRAILPLYECDKLVDDQNIAKTAALREEVRRELERKFLEVVMDNYYDDLDEVFVKISLSTMDIEFPDSYLSARQRIVDAEQAAIAAEAEKRAQITQAEGIRLATEEVAKGDAAAIEIKGSAENKVLRRKGEILTEKPAISENEVAKHYPQVVGGVMPTLSIKEMLNSGSTSSTPTP